MFACVLTSRAVHAAPQVDFLVTLMRDVLSRRPDLKLVLMSATLSAQVMLDYFSGCPGAGWAAAQVCCLSAVPPKALMRFQ